MTKDKEKLQNINAAMKIFDDWLRDFDKNNLSKENRPYLPLNAITSLLSLKNKYKLEDAQAEAFYKAYQGAKGEYKNLRTVSIGTDAPTWDIVRNSQLKNLLKEIEEDDSDLWEDELPTKKHLKLILWAYSPEASKIKKNIAKFEEKLGSGQKQSSDESEEEEEGYKRKSSDGSSSEESPKKKKKST